MKVMITLLTLIIFNSYAVTSTVKFTAKTDGPGISVEGEVKKADLAIDFNTLNKAVFSSDIMDLSTGMERRDKHLHEKVFNTANAGVSKIEYQLSKINCPQTNATTVECDCIGNLKIKDVSNEIKFKIQYDKSAKKFEGKTSVSLNQFKLTSPSFMGISVLDDVEVLFKVSEK